MLRTFVACFAVFALLASLSQASLESGMPPPSSSSLKSGAAVPLDLRKWVGKRVLFISAHPDDIEAAVGGTIALLTAQGTEVFYTIATNGYPLPTSNLVYFQQ